MFGDDYVANNVGIFDICTKNNAVEESFTCLLLVPFDHLMRGCQLQCLILRKGVR